MITIFLLSFALTSFFNLLLISAPLQWTFISIPVMVMLFIGMASDNPLKITFKGKSKKELLTSVFLAGLVPAILSTALFYGVRYHNDLNKAHESAHIIITDSSSQDVGEKGDGQNA